MLDIRPCTLDDARKFVGENHRHNRPPVGHKFSIACVKIEGGSEQLVGVATVGRPVARMLDDGLTLEITRNCTDGTRNACTKLYGACVRAAQALGYKRIVTYTLETEPGTSLKASGWTRSAACRGRTWDTPARPRDMIDENGAKYSTTNKVRWERQL